MAATVARAMERQRQKPVRALRVPPAVPRRDNARSGASNLSCARLADRVRALLYKQSVAQRSQGALEGLFTFHTKALDAAMTLEATERRTRYRSDVPRL